VGCVKVGGFGVAELGPSVRGLHAFGIPKVCRQMLHLSNTDVEIPRGCYSRANAIICSTLYTITLISTKALLVQMRKCDARIRAIRLINLLLVTSVHIESVHCTTQIRQINMSVDGVDLQSNWFVEMSR
jgi:hypothetical protein